jgi:hypothetical protein
LQSRIAFDPRKKSINEQKQNIKSALDRINAAIKKASGQAA